VRHFLSQTSCRLAWSGAGGSRGVTRNSALGTATEGIVRPNSPARNATALLRSLAAARPRVTGTEEWKRIARRLCHRRAADSASACWSAPESTGRHAARRTVPTLLSRSRRGPKGACLVWDVPRREAMKSSTRHQARGKLKNLKGKIKEVAGIVTGHRKLEGEGKDQKLAGKAQEKLGQIEKVIGK
jgi:uncharacterized protein YjbJ (UPF0337 family)